MAERAGIVYHEKPAEAEETPEPGEPPTERPDESGVPPSGTQVASSPVLQA
jgi:hypothetical protein